MSLSIENDKHDFPIEILHHIIQYVHKTRDIVEFSKVNRNWNAVAQETLFHQIELSSYSSLKKYVSMMHRIVKVNSVKKKWFFKFRDLSNFNQYSYTYLHPHQYERMQSTISFDMRAVKYSKWMLKSDSSDILIELFKHCPNVEKWILPQLRIHKSLAVFSHLSHLEELDLSLFKGGKDGFFDTIFSSISLSCPLLKRLILGSSPCFDPSLNPLSSTALEKLGKCCLLEEFKLNGHSHLVHSHASHLNVLFRSCRNLKKVQMQGLCCSEYR